MSWLSQMLPPTDDPNKFLDEYIKGLSAATESANQANKNRYFKNIKAQKRGIRQSVKQQHANVRLLRGQEQEALGENALNFTNLGTQNEQDLMDRGLTNSSALATLRTGLLGDQQRAATNISNTANMNVLATRQQGQARTDALRQNLFNTRASRNDIGPDTSQLAALAQAAGQQTGEQRERSMAQIQGMLGGLFGGQQGGQYPGLMGGPQLMGQQQGGGGLGGLLGGIGGIAGSLTPLGPIGGILGSGLGGLLGNLFGGGGKKGF